MIIPTHEGEHFLPDTLASIVEQSRVPDELVLSDDSSIDKTVELATAFAKRAPFQVKVLRHDPSGITNNYLNALQHTDGDVLIVADQDDVWVETKTEVIEHVFQTNPTVVIASSDSILARIRK